MLNYLVLQFSLKQCIIGQQIAETIPAYRNYSARAGHQIIVKFATHLSALLCSTNQSNTQTSFASHKEHIHVYEVDPWA